MSMLNYDSGGSKEARRPPLVRGLPFFGNTFQFLRDTSRLLNDSYRRYGPVLSAKNAPNYRLRAFLASQRPRAENDANDADRRQTFERLIVRTHIHRILMHSRICTEEPGMWKWG
jgi:hypothetical protein